MSRLLIEYPVRVAKAVTTNLLAGLVPEWLLFESETQTWLFRKQTQ